MLSHALSFAKDQSEKEREKDRRDLVRAPALSKSRLGDGMF